MTSRKKPLMGDRVTLGALRIVVGKKVFSRKCSLSIQLGTDNPYLLLRYSNEGRKHEHYVHLEGDELRELKYYIAKDDEEESLIDEDPMTIIAFRVRPTDKNKLTMYPNAYNQKDSENGQKNGRHYISVELRDPDEFQVCVIWPF